MRSRALSPLFATFLLLAASAGANAQTEEGPTYREREAALLAAYPELIVRDGARLTFQTESGEPLIIEDCPECSDESIFAAISYLEPFDSFVVFGLWNGEDAGYALVELKAGTVRWLAAEPVPDASGERFAAITPERLNDRPPYIEIGAWTGSGFEMEVDQEIGSNFEFAGWNGSDQIDLVCRQGPCMQPCFEVRELGAADPVCQSALRLRDDNRWYDELTMSVWLPVVDRPESSAQHSAFLSAAPPLGGAVPGWEKSHCGREWMERMQDEHLAEMQIFAAHPKNLIRTGDTLTIWGSDSGKQVFKDGVERCDNGYAFFVEAYLDALESYLVVTSFYEGRTYILVNRRTAAISLLDAEPHLDPSGRCFAAVSYEDMFDPGIQVGCYDGTTFTYEIDWSGFGYEFVEWVGSDRINLSMPGRNAEAVAYIERLQGRWRLIATMAMPLRVD